ncbi:MAG: 4-hydroxy-tetrahydrodipicolinate reductase [Paludibacteraceae bacterium]|nr:4-hydroxy-tetrahydrodipicolinate reductase [Paludibacteraceae bacterium]
MKIALIGYGKMGHLIREIAQERGHEIVCIIEQRVSADEAIPFVTFDSDEFRSADVAIEFTTPTTAADNIRQAWAQGVPVVSGTTGWSLEELRVESLEFRGASAHFDKASGDAGCPKENGIRLVDEQGKVWLIWKSNFSVGVNVFFELNKVLAQALAQYKQYTPSITETHHIHKLDKPSGTAVTLAEGIHSLLPYSSTPLPPIESIREGEVAGIHTVTWDSEEDTITITHSAKSRRGFALGAVLAAEGIGERREVD